MPLEDLQGVLSLRFSISMPGLSGGGHSSSSSDLPSGLIPNHKQSMALFLERVYGIEDRELFFKLLEDAFLPDLRAATMLEKVQIRGVAKGVLRGARTLPIFGTTKTNVFSTNAQSRFASVDLDDVLEPLRLARHT